MQEVIRWLVIVRNEGLIINIKSFLLEKYFVFHTPRSFARQQSSRYSFKIWVICHPMILAPHSSKQARKGAVRREKVAEEKQREEEEEEEKKNSI